MKAYLKSYFFKERLLYGIVLIVGDIMVLTTIYGRGPDLTAYTLRMWLGGSTLFYLSLIQNIKKKFSDENHQIQLLTFGNKPDQTLIDFKQILLKDLLQLTLIRTIWAILMHQRSGVLLIMVGAVMNAGMILGTQKNDL